MKESQSLDLSPNIGDVVPSLKAFWSLLRYLYTGDTNIPAEDAIYLFSASNYFGLTNLRLQVICKHNLEQNISIKNVFDILDAADRIQAGEMKVIALKLIAANFVAGKLSRHAKLRQLRRELLLDILDALAESKEKSATPALVVESPDF